MLVLACHIITNIPQNLKNLLFYKQEQIFHSQWITIANGYMKTLIFNLKNFTDTQKNKLQKIVSYIVYVYVPSFLIIHLNPKALEQGWQTFVVGWVKNDSFLKLTLSWVIG